MSPLTVRRYRAERLLRQEFDALRAGVVSGTRRRLRAAGVRLDASDLDACYAQAWHGLYTAVLDGEEILNVAGWLALVTYRRAIEEHRGRARVRCAGDDLDALPGARGSSSSSGASGGGTAASREGDFAAELDDRMRLRQLFEGLRGRLSVREQEAASLCYLQGLSRSEAAMRMGVSDARMRKLMEGRGAGSPGVAGKVGALVETIRAGSWCEEQGSLMRGFAFGILDPQGERYRLAILHRNECSACRAYVLSLRGLAAVLPPVPSLLHIAAGAGSLAAKGAATGARSGSGAHAGGAIGAGASTPAGPGAVGAGASASGAAGAGAGASVAGGGWLLAGGPVGAKLAVGCLLALGVGAGCVVLTANPGQLVRSHAGRRDRANLRAAHRKDRAPGVYGTAAGVTGQDSGALSSGRTYAPAGANAGVQASAAVMASREFGPEQASARGGERVSTASAGSKPDAGGAEPAARAAAAAASGSTAGAGQALVSRASPSRAPPSASARPLAGQSTAASAAEREFAPG
jgi:DNA-directed RNA polymerase specialized sigma24 family protein